MEEGGGGEGGVRVVFDPSPDLMSTSHTHLLIP